MTIPASGYTSATAATADGVIHYYPMRKADASGTVSDYVGSLDLTVGNSNPGNTEAKDLFNNCRNLTANGTGTSHNWIEHSAGTASFQKTWSAVIWFKPNTFTYSDQPVIIETRNLPAATGGWIASCNASTPDTFVVSFTAGSVGSMSSTAVLPTVGAANLLVVTSDETTTTIKSFLNNQSIGTATTSSQTFHLYDGDWTVGGKSGTSSDTRYFDGKVDEIAIFNRAITTGEIATLWNSGTGIPLIQKADGTTATGTDTVSFSEVAGGDFIHSISVADTMTLSEAAVYGWNTIASDMLGLDDSDTDAINKAIAQAADDLTQNDTPQVLIFSNGIASDDLTVDDAVIPNFRAYVQSSDSVGFISGMVISGETYYGIVLNTRHSGVTEYLQYSFDSMAKTGPNEYMASSADGIYEFDGSTTDNGANIDSHITTKLFDFNNELFKRCDRAYLGIRNDDSMVLKVITNNPDTGEKVENWYEMTDTTSEVRQRRISIGKGLKSHYWQFELASNDGASFELDNIEFVPIILSRRV